MQSVLWYANIPGWVGKNIHKNTRNSKFTDLFTGAVKKHASASKRKINNKEYCCQLKKKNQNKIPV